MPASRSYPPARPGVLDRLAAARHSADERRDGEIAKAPERVCDRRTAQVRRRAEHHGLIMCSICEEPIRGLTCYRSGQPCHFGCQGAARGDTSELDRLKPCHLRALENVREATRHLHKAALPRLRNRMETLGFRPEDADKTLAWIRDQAAVIIHVDLGCFGEKLARDTHYRNQFETGCSGGCLSTDTRTSWEAELFGDAYDCAAAFDRCKYGVLNVTNDPQGVRAAHSYGSSYLLLRNVRLRTTFSARDSGGINIEELATIDYYAHVLKQYADTELRAAVDVGTQNVPGRDSNVILSYKEAQIHGEVCLAEHVELIMVNPSLRGERHCGMLERLANICHAPVVWMEGGVDPHDAATVLPCSVHSADAGLMPESLGRSASEDAALSSEEEELAPAIVASRIAAAEARALETNMETAEAQELDQAAELSAAVFAEESELRRRLCEEDANLTDLAMAISAADLELTLVDSHESASCPSRLCAVDFGSRHSEAQSELHDEVAAFVSGCGGLAAESMLAHTSAPASPPSETIAVPIAAEAEDAHLAAAIKASMEAADQAKRIEAFEVEQMAQILAMSSEACAVGPFTGIPGDGVEDEDLARAIQASLVSAGVASAELTTGANVFDEALPDSTSEPVPPDSFATDATIDQHDDVPVVKPVATTLISDLEIDHLLKVNLGGDTRRLRASWHPSATPHEILTRIQNTVGSGFGLGPDVEYIARYEDEEGDRCTLAEPRVEDFLDSEGRGVLRLFVEAAAP